MIFSWKKLLNLKFNLCTIPPSSSSFTGRFSERGRASGRARRPARGATSLILLNLERVEWCWKKKLRHKTRTWISPTGSRLSRVSPLMNMRSWKGFANVGAKGGKCEERGERDRRRKKLQLPLQTFVCSAPPILLLLLSSFPLSPFAFTFRL